MSINRRVDKLQYIHTTESSSAVKGKYKLIHTTRRMNYKDVLSERS